MASTTPEADISHASEISSRRQKFDARQRRTTAARSEEESDRWQRFDILAKALVGSAGLILSLVLGYGEYRDRQRDEYLKTEQNREERRKDDVARDASRRDEFRAYYNQARQSKTDDPLLESDLDLIYAIAQKISTDSREPEYAVAALVLKRHFEKPNIGDAEKNDTNLQLSELGYVSSNPSIVANTSRWFAVIGSYPTNGLAQAEAKAKAFSDRGCIEIWKTKISGNYAVVYGSNLSQAQALYNAYTARKNGIASDAFAQADKGWSPIETCAKR